MDSSRYFFKVSFPETHWLFSGSLQSLLWKTFKDSFKNSFMAYLLRFLKIFSEILQDYSSKGHSFWFSRGSIVTFVSRFFRYFSDISSDCIPSIIREFTLKNLRWFFWGFLQIILWFNQRFYIILLEISSESFRYTLFILHVSLRIREVPISNMFKNLSLVQN